MMFTKRKYPRFPVAGVAIIKDPGSNLEIPGSLEMISQGGAGIFTDKALETGRKISMEFEIYTGDNNTTHCRMNGVVTNFKKWIDKGVLGVQFENEINKNDHPGIYQFLSYLEKKFITDYPS